MVPTGNQQQYEELRAKLESYIQPWRKLTIAIDGRDGVGKSPLARYLSWTLRMPAVETDMFIIPDSWPIKFRTNDLKTVLSSRHSLNRPVIVEGIFLLRTLEQVAVVPDFLVVVRSEGCDGSETWRSEFEKYESHYQPNEHCAFSLCLD